MRPKQSGGTPGAPPNLFLVGAMRAGTTTLHRVLARHAEIFMSRVKEPMHFALRPDDPPFRGPRDPGNDRYWARPERYARLFRGRGDAIYAGESSTLYLHEPEAPRRIREASPDARILIVLRDPARRAYSHYCFARQRGLEPEATFEAALADEARRSSRNWSSFWQYRGRSLYADAVERYLSTFSERQVFVGLFEELVEAPLVFYARIRAFLGLRAPFEGGGSVGENRSAGVRSVWIARCEQRLRRLVPAPVRAAVWGSLGGRWVRAAARPVRALNHKPPPPLDPRIEVELRRDLAPDIDRLSMLVDLDLERWDRG